MIGVNSWCNNHSMELQITLGKNNIYEHLSIMRLNREISFDGYLSTSKLYFAEAEFILFQIRKNNSTFLRDVLFIGTLRRMYHDLKLILKHRNLLKFFPQILYLSKKNLIKQIYHIYDPVKHLRYSF